MKAIIGKKIGMSQLFDEDGVLTPVTVIQAGPCVVTQVKKSDGKDGYDAVQLGFDEVPERKLSRPERGHLKKAKKLMRHLVEFQLDGELKVGAEVKVDVFDGIETVDISGVTKGKGFQGVIKRHGFAGGPASHGSHFHRAPGSIGASATPSRVFKGMRLPGQMGNVNRTAQNLKVQRIDTENDLLIVAGSVPGSRNGLLLIRAR